MAYLKFRHDEDKIKFCVEVNRIDLIDSECIPHEAYEAFIKKRKKSVLGLKDFRKSQISKKAWRENRWQYLKGIHKFHRSIAGKRFHRAMGRFLATRLFDADRLKYLKQMQGEALTAISSIKTHFYIESQYYMPLAEEIDFQLLFDYAVPLLIQAEEKLLEQKPESLAKEELELLIRLIDKKEIYKPTKELKNERLVQKWKSLDEKEDSSFKNLDFIESEEMIS